MILVDYNQISISNLMELNNRDSDHIDFDLVRHMILNTIRGYRKRWHEEYGEIVIACDNRRYWRRKVFPNYKARKKTREDSGMIGTQSLMFLVRSRQNLMSSCRIQ